MTSASFVAGLDLGQTQDPSALVLLERTVRPDGTQQLALRHLKRWPLGTPYVAAPGSPHSIAESLRVFLASPALKGGLPLVLDQTGVGRAVYDALLALGLPCWLIPVSITSGLKAAQDEGGWKVPKKDLVGAVQVLLGQGRLLIARDLPLADTLAKELSSFKVKLTTAGNETFEAWRERDHDDLVLALALGCWWSEKHPVTGGTVLSGGGSIVRDALRRLGPGHCQNGKFPRGTFFT